MKKLTFRSFALRPSLWWRANARNVSFFTLYGGQFTFSTQLLTLNYLLFFNFSSFFCLMCLSLVLFFHKQRGWECFVWRFQSRGTGEGQLYICFEFWPMCFLGNMRCNIMQINIEKHHLFRWLTVCIALVVQVICSWSSSPVQFQWILTKHQTSSRYGSGHVGCSSSGE